MVCGLCALANPADDTGRFISLQGDISGNSGFVGTGLGYGQNIVFHGGQEQEFDVNVGEKEI